MIDLTQLLFTSLLAALLGFLVLVLPLIFMFAGHLRPWFLQMAAERSTGFGALSISSAPLARRNTSSRARTGSRKVAVSKSSSGSGSGSGSGKKAPTVRKTAKKKAPARKTTRKKAASATAKKSPAKSKTVSKKSAASPKKKATKRGTAKAKTKKAPAGAKLDPELGLIYSKKPATPDDLKKISGVAKVLEGKLHAEGVYTYQQIADWTRTQMDAFGERLSFKNRIQRDDWKKQAKALHKAKHG